MKDFHPESENIVNSIRAFKVQTNISEVVFIQNSYHIESDRLMTEVCQCISFIALFSENWSINVSLINELALY